MFYRLQKNYCLRGWEKATCMLLKRPENVVWALSPEEFQCLLLCDGETEWQQPALQPVLEGLVQRGIVEPCSTPRPLEEDQLYRYYHNRYVESIFWSVTGRCNYRCRHCYMDAPTAALGELSTEQALGLIDQMADCGVLRVDLTGGEPLVRKDFWQLVDRLAAHQIAIGTIYTNGGLLTAEVLDAFERRGMKPDFNLSFDGVGWHDWMRGTQGAEQAALKALRLCRERGYYTTISMCVHKGSLSSIPATVAALKEAGAARLKICNIDSTELWRRNSDGQALSDEEYVQAVMEYIPWFFEAGRPMELRFGGVIQLHSSGVPYRIDAERFNGTEDCQDCWLCGAVRSACYITPDGRLLPCLPMTASPVQQAFPKIQEIGLRQGLSDSIYMEFANRRVKDLFAANLECATCPYRLRCGGGCRAQALLNGEQDLMGADRSQCLLWRKGYVEKIRQVAEAACAGLGE